jgi:hypothetical protein
LKVSLHRSGIWRIAYVADIKRRDPTTDRLVLRWQRPESRHGWTPSLATFVPSIQPDSPFAAEAEEDHRIDWTALPAEGLKVILKVLISNAGIGERDSTAFALPTDRLIAPLRGQGARSDGRRRHPYEARCP